jgi:hypothetical protein
MKKIVVLVVLLSFCLVLSSSLMVYAAKVKKPTVLGTTQMSGFEGKIGKTFTVGTRNPINITLLSAEYSVDVLKIGARTFFPRTNEKFVIIRYKLQNPQNKIRYTNGAQLSIGAVDSNDTSIEFNQIAGIVSSKNKFAMLLRPAQKIEVFSFAVVPADASIPKIIIKNADGPVFRYYINKDIKPLSAPFADPSDPTGAKALTQVPAKLGETYPLSQYKVKVNKILKADAATVLAKTPRGKVAYIAEVEVKNDAAKRLYFADQTFRSNLIDENGAKVRNTGLFNASLSDKFSEFLEPGQTMKLNMLFVTSPDFKWKTFSNRIGDDGREFIYMAE